MLIAHRALEKSVIFISDAASAWYNVNRLGRKAPKCNVSLHGLTPDEHGRIGTTCDSSPTCAPNQHVPARRVEQFPRLRAVLEGR